MVPAFLYSINLTLYKTDITLRWTLCAATKGVRLRENLLYFRNKGILKVTIEKQTINETLYIHYEQNDKEQRYEHEHEHDKGIEVILWKTWVDLSATIKQFSLLLIQ